MRFIVAILFSIFTVMQAQAEEFLVELENAKVQFCNHVKQSDCSKSEAYGAGYGLITFSTGRLAKMEPLPLIPVGFLLKAEFIKFSLFQMAVKHDKKTFKSDTFEASGYIGFDFFSLQSVFYLTDMNLK